MGKDFFLPFCMVVGHHLGTIICFYRFANKVASGGPRIRKFHCNQRNSSLEFFARPGPRPRPQLPGSQTPLRDILSNLEIGWVSAKERHCCWVLFFPFCAYFSVVSMSSVVLCVPKNCLNSSNVTRPSLEPLIPANFGQNTSTALRERNKRRQRNRQRTFVGCREWRDRRAFLCVAFCLIRAAG